MKLRRQFVVCVDVLSGAERLSVYLSGADSHSGGKIEFANTLLCVQLFHREEAFTRFLVGCQLTRERRLVAMSRCRDCRDGFGAERSAVAML
jgi:hypothetical protein